MKVILKQDVKGLGKKGELVNASDGYARNYLFPKNIAIEADAQGLTEMENAIQSKQHKIDVETENAQTSANKINGKTIKLTAKAGSNGKLFGSITAKEIAKAITDEYRIDVDKRKKAVSEIKSFGTYNAEIKFYGGITAEIKVSVSES